MTTTRLDNEPCAILAPFLSVVVPVYNEGEAVTHNLTRLHDHLLATMRTGSWELILVDDGSVDDTASRLEGFASGYDAIRIFRRERNGGVGAAMKSGIDKARGACVVTIDSDLSYEPSIMNRLVEEFQRVGASIVLASPYMSGGRTENVPPIRLFMSVWANRLLSLASGGRIKTFTGMVRAYDRAFLSELLWPESSNANVGVLLAARRAGAKIVEIPAVLAWPPERGVPRLSYRRAVHEILAVLHYSVDFALTRNKV
jgi:dolichol-phosphate mannosyltransferase